MNNCNRLPPPQGMKSFASVKQSANNLSLKSEASLAATLARRIIDANEHHTTMSNHQLACQEIRKHRFCPPLNIRPPLICIASPALALRDKDFAERVLTERMEQFGQHFFSIPIEERKKIWLKLEPRVRTFPQLAWRLNTLKPGLTINAPVPNEFSYGVDLAQHTCEAFVMTPANAGNSLRRKFCEMFVSGGKVKETRKSLANLAREYPGCVRRVYCRSPVAQSGHWPGQNEILNDHGMRILVSCLESESSGLQLESCTYPSAS
jgi:hypothetical protein